MAPKKSILERMRNNPRNDWVMSDIEKVAAKEGIELRKPSGGSHYVAVSEHLRDVLPIPASKPIKFKYIILFVSLVDAHRRGQKDEA